ncbi:LppP/LprE family lipoprotein [Streptomyces netropsis]|uniref:LppP/LprE lipoprotein n=1 Tax=Streptomyces netropsis TaxID=55404 RepID=A0A7W7PGY3_STRNE|nr:LppP/LprE family lipoprotein [Streptomyces netropsis]MBB4888215.1 hypothetical protein [Streptomyces netropsis]GGR31230.1 hypothetical protein GCM10010219_39850 [Streptomyces netropsis]
MNLPRAVPALTLLALYAATGCAPSPDGVRTHPSSAPTGSPESAPSGSRTPSSASPSGEADDFEARTVRRLMAEAGVSDMFNDPADQPGPLRAVAGSCPHVVTDCQVLYFFHGSRKVGDLTTELVSVRSSDGTTVTVRFPQFTTGDPQCCPSGRPKDVRWRWEGSSLEADFTLPPGTKWNQLDGKPRW